MLDIHILTLPGLPEEWIKQRRDSIEAAVAAAGFPVYVHEVEGIDGHLGRSRKKGYSVGSQPYVTHVDHDDWIREDAFAVLKKYLEEGVEAITTGEVLVRGSSHMESPKDKHHLAVYKREWLHSQPYDRFEFYPDQFLVSRAKSIHVPECVYFHRIEADSHSRRQRGASPNASKEEMRMIRTPELFQVELMSYKALSEEIDKEMEDA